VKGIAGSFLAGIIILAVVFVLVRPGSQGPTLVSAVSNGLGGLLGKATGGGTWAGAPKGTPAARL
jgi:hypothetical protein